MVVSVLCSIAVDKAMMASRIALHDDLLKDAFRRFDTEAGLCFEKVLHAYVELNPKLNYELSCLVSRQNSRKIRASSGRKTSCWHLGRDGLEFRTSLYADSA